MNVKEASRAAKAYINDLFADEQLLNVGLEEVISRGPYWEITIGFSRSWDRKGPLVSALAESRSERSYKVIRINAETGHVESLMDRRLKA